MLALAYLLADSDGSGTGAVWIVGLLAASGPLSALAALVGLFATRREVESLEKRLQESRDDLKAFRAEVAGMEMRLNAASEKRAENTHERINEILAGLSRLGGQFDESRHH